MALHGEIEDGWLPPGSSAKLPHGGSIISEQGNNLMSPEELVMWEELYQTIVDCYKIATGQYKHFICMRWSMKNDPLVILKRAESETREWIGSEDFTANLKYMGYDADKAVAALRDILEGKNTVITERMLTDINKKRDARRSRGGELNG